jgi:hypothetical protein
MSETTKPPEIKPTYPWWEFLFPGLIFLLGSVFAWWYLTDLEAQPGAHRVRLPSAAVLLYRWGGKWAIVLFIAGVGAFFSAIGLVKLIRKLRHRSTRDPDRLLGLNAKVWPPLQPIQPADSTGNRPTSRAR